MPASGRCFVRPPAPRLVAWRTYLDSRASRRAIDCAMLERVVRGCVIDQDDLEVNQGLAKDGLERGRQELARVVGRGDDGNRGRRGHLWAGHGSTSVSCRMNTPPPTWCRKPETPGELRPRRPLHAAYRIRQTKVRRNASDPMRILPVVTSDAWYDRACETLKGLPTKIPRRSYLPKS